MRLTEKGNDCYYPARKENGQLVDHYETDQKLGQLEDIEEELGIDLLNVKFKVEIYYMRNYKKDGKYQSVYVYLKSNKKIPIYHFWPTGISVLLSGEDVNICQLSYKDYGKTWALTREELEK